jgi:outer membrane protein
MKKCTAFVFALVLCAAVPCAAAEKNGSVKIGTVSFKTVLEKSQVGIREQAHFDTVRKQMEQSLERQEKELNELAPKFTDEYLDSLTPEAEAELKEKFRTLSQDLTQKQNEYYQTLQQEQMQVMRKLFEVTSTAASELAKERGYDLILNDESCLYKADGLDLSADIIKKLDTMKIEFPKNATSESK